MYYINVSSFTFPGPPSSLSLALANFFARYDPHPLTPSYTGIKPTAQFYVQIFNVIYSLISGSFKMKGRNVNRIASRHKSKTQFWDTEVTFRLS